MGRESRLLLALLGLLAGVFVAALAARLFIPRPPQGAGPDIQISTTAAGPTPIVTPPDLTPGPQATRPPHQPVTSRPQQPPQRQAEPLALAQPPQLEPVSPVMVPSQPQTQPPPPSRPPPPAATTLVSNTQPVTTGQPSRERPGQGPPPWERGKRAAVPMSASTFPVQQDTPPAAAGPAADQAPGSPQAPPAAAAVVPGQSYEVVADDCWWSIAERAYGDGRYYRSLFAWNRAVNPRVSLAVGTLLEIPPATRLQLAWPRLVPAD